MNRKKISYSELNIGEQYESEFIISEDKINEYYQLFERPPLPYTPPYLLMLLAFKPIAEIFSIVPGTIHASQAFTLKSFTNLKNFKAKAFVKDKYIKRDRKYIVIAIEIKSGEIKIGSLIFRFAVPE